MENDDGQFVYTIHGVKVSFPCKAYPTQLSMMNMIIKGIERHQNSLLESPTGSGKSLALLCSCLAWQSAEYEKKAKIEEQMKAEIGNDECCIKTCSDEQKQLPIDPANIIKSDYFQQNNSSLHVKISPETPLKTEAAATLKKMPEQSESLPGKDVKSGSPTDDDFQPAKKRFRTPGNNQQTVSSSKKRRVHPNAGPSGEDEADYEPPEWTMELTTDREGKNTSPSTAANALDNKDKLSPDDSGKSDSKSERLKIPKIFFGTRTHKQIAQISRELKKTVYKHVKMTILSSREHSCVHPVVSKGKKKNEECKKLLDGSEGMTCRYYQKVHTIRTQTSLRYHGLSVAWDIEDLVTLGSQIKACPYFAARELMKEADVIFCPYNYLIDPKIRMQMDINLKDQIVVLDEAHNVEDSAREAGSLTLTAVELQNTLDELDRLVQMQVLTEHHRPLHLMIGSFLRWIHESSAQLKERSFEQSSKVWSGMEIIAAMEKQAITPGTFYIYFEHYQYIMATIKDPTRSNDMPTLSSHSQSLLEGIFLVGKYMMANNMQYISDYRCAVLKTSVMVRDVVLPGGWRRSHGGARKEWTQSLNFWCLNPAVVFSELGSQARCIVLTSGTLSPMASFSSELGIKFPIQLEANHVIANSQVWVGTLSSGPSGSAINASYHSAETFTFQDEVGKILLNVCETVPHGVLCFFPSYNMLDKLSKRWQSTGLWSKLVDRKVLVSEPRSGDKSDFDDIMHQFYHAVRASEGEESNMQQDSDDESCVDGGLFLAVCRGKVSEGLDFADNNARAVVTIGIPFPNVKDVQVELKRKYNTQYSASRGLLTGSEWYEIQAYRALNQALGRCIRHKQDWGAILLIDERFNKSPKYTNGISKWVRKRIAKFNNFNEAMSSLKEFATVRKLDPCPSGSSPGSLSQLSKSTVETPAKEQGVHFRTKPLEDDRLSPQLDPSRTPVQYTGTKPFAEQTSPVNYQGNKISGFMPASHLTPSALSEATPHGVSLSVERAASKLAQFKRKSVGQDKSEKHVFKGMESISDFTPRNGGNVLSSKRNEVNEDKKFVNQVSVGKVDFNHTSENHSNEQLSYSPVLFATPQSSPSPSPVKQEFDTYKPVEREVRTDVNSSNMNSFCNTSSYAKTVENGYSDLSKSSIQVSKDISDFEESGGQGFAVKEIPCEVKEESKPRDFLDEVETDFPLDKSELANRYVDSNVGAKKCFDGKNCKSEMPSNVRQGRRKSSRLRRSSNGTGCTEKEQKEECEEKPEVKGGNPILSCGRCGSNLVAGRVVVRPFPQKIPELLRSSFRMLETIDDKSINVIDKGACEILNLGYPVADAKNDDFSGVNSVFVPESEICYIPQVCKVCQSTRDESHIVGLQVVSFRTFSEEVWLFPSIVFNRQPSSHQN